MGIDAVERSERGEKLEAVYDPQMILSTLVQDPTAKKADLSQTTCLRFLDPYGEAMFNQLQLPVLVAELESLAKSTRETRLRDHLSAVAQLARNCIRHVHTYLWFIGD